MHTHGCRRKLFPGVLEDRLHRAGLIHADQRGGRFLTQAFAIGLKGEGLRDRADDHTALIINGKVVGEGLQRKPTLGREKVCIRITVELAEGFGAVGMRATTPEELRERLREAIKSPEPVVIEVPVSELPSPWDFVLMPKLRGV